MRQDPQLANNPKTPIGRSFHRPFASHWGVLVRGLSYTMLCHLALWYSTTFSKPPTDCPPDSFGFRSSALRVAPTPAQSLAPEETKALFSSPSKQIGRFSEPFNQTQEPRLGARGGFFRGPQPNFSAIRSESLGLRIASLAFPHQAEGC